MSEIISHEIRFPVGSDCEKQVHKFAQYILDYAASFERLGDKEQADEIRQEIKEFAKNEIKPIWGKE